MSQIVLLDSGPLSFILAPAANARNRQCSQWLEHLLLRGADIWVPEICDYEVRRGLMRVAMSQNKTADERAIHLSAIEALNVLKSALGYVPITTEAMLKTAEFWAEVRNRGFPNASDDALDGDIILCAQATLLAAQGHTVMIATENVKHLSLLFNAKNWREITLP